MTASIAAVISGIGAVVPPGVVTNDDLARRLDTSDAWIRQRTGILQRHAVDATISTSDLAVAAGRRAMENAGVAAVDEIYLATTTPDRPCPATAPAVASRLGLTGIAAIDLAAVCSGFVYALRIGANAITAGAASRVLVVAAESFTTILDPEDRSTTAIFGDGAGAVVLSRGEPTDHGALIAFDTGSDGDMRDFITIRAGGAEQRTKNPDFPAEDSYFRMDGKPVFTNAIRHMTASSRAVLAETGWSTADIDKVVAHQANIRIIHAVAEQLGLPLERAVTNIDHVGNTAGASIPLALAEAAALGDLRAGDRILLTAFGGGATWGSATLTWPRLDRIVSPPKWHLE